MQVERAIGVLTDLRRDGVVDVAGDAVNRSIEVVVEHVSTLERKVKDVLAFSEGQQDAFERLLSAVMQERDSWKQKALEALPLISAFMQREPYTSAKRSSLYNDASSWYERVSKDDECSPSLDTHRPSEAMDRIRSGEAKPGDALVVASYADALYARVQMLDARVSDKKNVILDLSTELDDASETDHG